MAVSLPPSYRPLPPCPPRRPIVNQLSERGRDPRAPDIAHRNRDNLRASTGKAIATVLTLCTRRSGGAGTTGDAAWIVGGIGGTAFPAGSAFPAEDRKSTRLNSS